MGCFDDSGTASLRAAQKFRDSRGKLALALLYGELDGVRYYSVGGHRHIY